MILLAELERMVDDSLRIADQVMMDDQSLYGEIYLMRNAIWVYRPYVFQICYTVKNGEPLVLTFQYSPEAPKLWKSLADTDQYRKVLKEADVWRRSCP